MFDFILDPIKEFIRDKLKGWIEDNLFGLFSGLNSNVAGVATEVRNIWRASYKAGSRI
jgi:hypothetical protein